MDDLLSAALCESGLGEFLCQTSPVPSTSGSCHDETSRDAPLQPTQPTTSTNFDDIDDAAIYEDFFPSSSKNITMETIPPPVECMVIPRKQPPEENMAVGKDEKAPKIEKEDLKKEVKEEEEDVKDGIIKREIEDVKPLHVQVTRTSNENSCSPSPRILTATSQRSMTSSPASSSTFSNHSQQPSPAPSSSTKVSPIGPIIKRTIHTRNGIQTQYLKPYINAEGQKIYRALNTVPATVASVQSSPNTVNSPASRGTLTLRGTPRQQIATRTIHNPAIQPQNGERIVMVRQEGPNGQQVLVKKVLSNAPFDPARRGGSIIRGNSQRGTTNLIIRNGNGRGSTIQTQATQPNYRVTNLVGRTSGGATMMNHQLTRITRGAGMIGRGGVRYTTTRSDSPLHFSQSSPTFQYLDQTDGSSSPYPPPGNGRIMQRGRMTAGFDMSDRQRLMLSTSSTIRQPGSGLASPRIVTPQFSPLTSAVISQQPAILTKSQKAKDEMKMAYQMGKEEAMVQRKNDMDDDDENLGYAETYSEYTPAKLRSGMAHPDSVVESASLSSVSPPDVKYQISIPEYLIDMGHISALQLEAVIYACQMHERRMPSGERYGYLIGDGAGVGKGRTVSCIIFENYLQGRKRAIWLSVSSDLKFDAERDLRDVGAPNIAVHALNKMKYAKISGKENGSIKKGVIFATYTSLIGECRGAKSKKYRSRIKQLIQWFGTDYDGVIILDECHRAKNLVPTAGAKPTKTGRMVLELQKALPNARVVYASATGATEPRNMAYMTRLGLWGERQAFPEFSDFITAVERRGVGAMEIVAMDMKQRGLYLARQLSFRGVSFAVQEVQLSADFVKIYDDAVKLWMEVRRQFQTVLENMDEEDRSQCKTVWGQFWACHQRFFKYLCIAAKVDTCVRLTRESIKAKKCVVIGLQSTGESATLETLEEMGGELNEFVSTAKTVMYGLIDKHFPTEGGSHRDMFDDLDFGERPAKRRKNHQDTLSFLGDYGSWTGATVGMSGRVGQSTKNNGDDDNSTTSESSDDDKSIMSEDEEKSWDSAREEAEGARTLDDCEEDEWVKALLAEAESSSDSEEEEEDGNGDDDDSRQPPLNDTKDETEEEFNPFMCDFTNNDPWANKQQIVEEKPEKSSKSATKKRKRVEEVETEEMKERRKKREERREKKLRRAKRKAEREKKRRQEALQSRGNANDFITSSRLCGAGDEDKSNINPMLIKTELLAAVERLAPSLPANTLDQLIDELGGPEYVAEMTGRRGHMVTSENGDVMYERRNANAEVSLELINMEEKEKFMRGEKLIAIISEAASSGISLQSDRRAINKRRRVHITLELPWSADKAIQQFGRTHRSNQVSGPEYVFLISELAGEKRFASVVAKRLESLGALTHGDRRATETRDLSQFNMDNKYGRVALDVLLKTVIGQNNPPLIEPPKDYKAGDFLEDMRLYMEGVGLLSRNKSNGQYIIEKEAATIPKFLNRILGLPVHAQNALFVYFSEIVAELIAQSKHDGTYDTGIMDLGTGDDQVRKLETRFFLGRADNGSFRVEIHKIGVERGVSWEEAIGLYKDHNTDEDGFYVCQPGVNGSGRKVAALIYGIGKVRMDNGARLYAITRPSTGRSPKLMIMADLKKRFSKVTVEEAKSIWEAQYEGAANMCQHNYIYGKCRTEAGGTYCEVGRRTRTYFVLSGSVLSVWPIVEEVLSGNDRKSSRMQVIRVRTEQDQKIVGLLVLPNHVRTLVQQLEGHCGRSIVKTDEN